MNYGEVKCPKCLESNDLLNLRESTEYGCWSDEKVQVYCLHCDHPFEVHCDFQGYEPSFDSFDMNEFVKVHKVKLPSDSNIIFVYHYLKELVQDGKTELVRFDEERYKSHNPQWAEAYKVAMAEWQRIKKHLKSE